jgi:tetratricopeptide (TPR) repeat protein
VLSPRIDVANLVKLSGLEPADVEAALERAERHAMLQASERGSSFAHALIARAVYNDISPLRRQVMHRRIAELLHKDRAQELGRAADLAHHASLSGDPGLAARAMISAGRLCLRFFANDDALSLARKGLQLACALPDAERVCAEIDLHDILLAAGPLSDRESAARSYAVLAERALDHGALSHARLGYHMAAYVRWTQGKWRAAREQTLQAERVVRGGQEEAQIVGMAETAKCLVMIERDLSRADAMLMEASALAERRGFSHHAIAAGLGMLHFHENRLDEAEERFREARALCKSAGDRLNEFQANEYLIMLDLQRGRLEPALERSRELVALGDKLREGSEEPFARAIVGLCTYAIEDDAVQLDAALTDLRVADAKHRLAYILTRAALIDSERGRIEAATERASEALGYATLLERATEMLLANALLSHQLDARGDSQRAARFRQEVERFRADGASLWTLALAEELTYHHPPRPLRQEAR